MDHAIFLSILNASSRNLQERCCTVDLPPQKKNDYENAAQVVKAGLVWVTVEVLIAGHRLGRD